MRVGGNLNEGFELQLLEAEDREYELALAPLKRLLKKGSHPEGKRPLKIGKAGLLTFQKAVEDYALRLAEKAGENTRHWPGLYRIERHAILRAIDDLYAPTSEKVIHDNRHDGVLKLILEYYAQTGDSFEAILDIETIFQNPDLKLEDLPLRTKEKWMGTPEMIE